MNDVEQRISKLTPEDETRLAELRAVIEAYIGNDETRQKYQKPAGKLGLLRALIDQKVFKANQTHELQCMGVVLGDVFVQEMGLEWVIVEDEYGRDFAIQVENTSIILFPLTMISKRIEDGEEVDVFELFNGLAAKIDELKNN